MADDLQRKLKEIRSFVGAKALLEAQRRIKMNFEESDSLFGLDWAERLSVWLYTDSRDHAVKLNRQLRSDAVSLSASGFGAILVGAIDKLPKFRGRVYRGITLGVLRNARNVYDVGNVIEWSAFTSASRLREAAFGGNVTFLIHSLSGRSLQGYAVLEEEQEVLFAPMSRFKVLECIEFLIPRRVAIELEEVAKP